MRGLDSSKKPQPVARAALRANSAYDMPCVEVNRPEWSADVKLRDLQLLPGPHPALSLKEANMAIREAVDHVSELVYQELPRDFTVAAGKPVKKVVVVIGSSEPALVVGGVLRVGWSKVPFSDFLALSRRLQEETALVASQDPSRSSSHPAWHARAWGSHVGTCLGPAAWPR